MKSISIIQNVYSITWLAALQRAVEQWSRKYSYYLSRFLVTSEFIQSFLAHIDLADPRQDVVLYHYYKKAIDDHTGLSGFVRAQASVTHILVAVANPIRRLFERIDNSRRPAIIGLKCIKEEP
jgi:hypothetical protein